VGPGKKEEVEACFSARARLRPGQRNPVGGRHVWASHRVLQQKFPRGSLGRRTFIRERTSDGQGKPGRAHSGPDLSRRRWSLTDTTAINRGGPGSYPATTPEGWPRSAGSTGTSGPAATRRTAGAAGGARGPAPSTRRRDELNETTGSGPRRAGRMGPPHGAPLGTSGPRGRRPGWRAGGGAALVSRAAEEETGAAGSRNPGGPDRARCEG